MTLPFLTRAIAPMLAAVLLSTLPLFSGPAHGEAAVSADEAQLMKAIVYYDYGAPDVLQLEDIDKPVPDDDQILVRVRAASVNPLDWHYMRGAPYIMRFESGLRRPGNTRMGVDYAGTVEAVGKNVTHFKPGDEVYGGKNGAFAEYIVTNEVEGAVVLKPANMTFEQAATVPIAAITALQGLRDKGHVQPGQKVLINGASGGVGTFAVQIAKAFGANVTGVCSTRNLAMVESLGADRVIDYTQEDFTSSGERYDLILDLVANHSVFKLQDVLEPDGTLVLIGAAKGNWIGPLLPFLEMLVISPFVDQELVGLLAELNKEDLSLLSELMADGKVTPVIDRRYPLDEVADAIRYLEEGHARGKVIITFD